VPAKKRHNIESLTFKNLEWVYVSGNADEDINALKKGFNLHPVDLRDVLPPLQRPKLVPREDYIFMILLYPVFDADKGTVSSSEVDFFIFKDRLITINSGRLAPLQKFFNSLKKQHGKAHSAEPVDVSDVSHLIYRILNDLMESVSPMIIDFSKDIDLIEDRLFKEFEKGLIQELLRVKTNIVNVRKAIQGHKTVIRKLIEYAQNRIPIKKLEVYFDRLVEQTKEIWDVLEVERDTINALHEANVSLIDFRINEIMKTLTLFAVIVFPLTLLAAIFGMNSKYMPFVDGRYGFWIILGLMAAGVVAMVFYFRKKGWL